MNEQLQQELVNYLASLRETLGSGTAFVVEQAPEYVRQLLTYDLIMAYAGMLLAVVLLSQLIWPIRLLKSALELVNWERCPNEEKRERLRRLYNADAEMPRFFGGALGVVVIGAAVVKLTITNFSTILQIHLAPHVYIVEHISKVLP